MSNQTVGRLLADRVLTTSRRLSSAIAGKGQHGQHGSEDSDIEALAVSVGALTPVTVSAGRKRVMP